MITEKDKTIIQELSKKYHAKRVLLFGSGLDQKRKSNDIDIAVEGIPHKDFFKYYGDLLLQLSKPVDIIDLDGSSKFIDLIKQEGKLLYG
jgi:predicted nucleotidyltransferase